MVIKPLWKESPVSVLFAMGKSSGKRNPCFFWVLDNMTSYFLFTNLKKDQREADEGMTTLNDA